MHTHTHAHTVSCNTVHTLHTGIVQAIHYSPHNQIIYSGGPDRRLIAWDFTKGVNILQEKRQEGKIRDLLPIPGKPELMLVGCNEVRNQLRVWDQRTQEFVLSFANDDATCTASKYIHPSVGVVVGVVVVVVCCIALVHSAKSGCEGMYSCPPPRSYAPPTRAGP
jgi:WD40 repeat protein